MCLVVFGWQAHPDYRLVLAANRDEYHGRPAKEAHWWPDLPAVLAGRDSQAGGTWLGLGKTGRGGVITNYREHETRNPAKLSRGELIPDFVTGNDRPHDFAQAVGGTNYAGFNLLLFDHEEMSYVSNRGDHLAVLDPGIYGLGNASLDTPWPKLVRSKRAFGELLATTGRVNSDELMDLLADRQPASVDDIEPGELPQALATALSSPFIVTPEYGTRCSSVILWSHDGTIEFSERRFDASGTATGESRFSYQYD